MKKIAVVSDSTFKNNRVSLVGNHLKSNLEEIFEKKVEIQTVYIDQLTEHSLITADLVLVMASSRWNIMKAYVDDPSKIIVIKRTFLKKDIYPLYNIPKNSDVLVVNDVAETILESVSALYHIGIRHINLIPYEEGHDYHGIKYAISPSEVDFIPDYIQEVIDIGNRVIDISTMLFIMSTLELQDKEIQNNFYQYYQKILSPNDNMEDHYNKLLVRTEELDYLLDLSHDGILLTDQSGKILISNKVFAQIFEIKKPIEGEYLHEILPSIGVKNYYSAKTLDDIITYKNKTINLEKKEIVHYNKEIKMYFSFQEVTYIKKLEQNLTQKLRQKGQIARYSFDDIVTKSPTVKNIISKSRKIAQSDLTVLITGESGTGKEVLAQALHNASNRSKQPFIAINAAAIPEHLLESELFGYSSGSFTGALKEGKKGIFERANNGTIFLDEIGDMPNHLQSKLLRVLQEKQITPIGADHIIEIDVRVIAATHKNLVDMVQEGQFRQDLFYRLNVFSIDLPPLRKRKEDILLLLRHFTDNRYDIEPNCETLLNAYDWPGNIREIGNVAHYITTLDESKTITVESLPHYIRQTPLPANEMILDPKNDQLVLLEKHEKEVVFKTLNAIFFLNNIGKTAGRKHLISCLNKENIILQESALRKILSDLNQSNFIDIKKGRSGSYITEKGISFLKKQDSI